MSVVRQLPPFAPPELNVLERAVWYANRLREAGIAFDPASPTEELAELYRKSYTVDPAAATTTGTTPVKVVSLDDFVAVTEDTADPLIGERGDSLLPADGLLLMYGDGGAGKTTLTIDALVHLAAGASWLDTTVQKNVKALLIENEGPRGPFREMLAKKVTKWQGDPFAVNVRVLEEPWTQFTLTDPGYRQTIADEIDAHEIDLVIVGPLASIGARGTGTPDDINEFSTLIADLRGRTARPFALWIVHHENKAGDISGAWERLPDTLVHVTAQGNGRTRVHWRKVRWSSRLHNTSVQLLWDDGGFRLEEARMRDLPAELLAKFAQSDDPWLTAKQLSVLAKANVDKVKEVLKQLEIEGKLVFQIGPTGRNVNARCWRLRGDSEPLSHPESPTLFQGEGSPGDSVTPPMKESRESHHLPHPPAGDSDSPSQLTPDDHLHYLDTIAPDGEEIDWSQP